MVDRMSEYKNWGESKLTPVRGKFFSWHVPKNLATLLGLSRKDRVIVSMNLDRREILLQFKSR